MLALDLGNEKQYCLFGLNLNVVRSQNQIEHLQIFMEIFSIEYVV